MINIGSFFHKYQYLGLTGFVIHLQVSVVKKKIEIYLRHRAVYNDSC